MENKFQFAKTLVREVGQLVRANLNQHLVIEAKTDFTDLVTNMDKAVQDQLARAILARYPQDIIFGEESEQKPPYDVGQVWLIDPIDGTSNFIVQQADFVIMLAYFEDGVGQFALIYDVMQDKLYHGGGQFEVYENDRRLFPYQQQPLQRSLIGVNAAMYADNRHGLRDLARQVLGVRTYGSAGLTATYVLTGRLMGYFSYICPWDYAAAMILGDKLGYTTLQIDGSPLDFKGRTLTMMVPKVKLAEIQTYLKDDETT